MSTNKLLRSAGAVETYGVTKAFPPLKSLQLYTHLLLFEGSDWIYNRQGCTSHYSYKNANMNVPRSLRTDSAQLSKNMVTSQELQKEITCIYL